MPEYHDPATAPPSTTTLTMIVVMSIIILIGSGYMIYNYSSMSPAAKSTSTPASTAR
jgi:hypothetical protein